MTAPKKWSELSSLQHAAIILPGVIELSLTAAALVDLFRRPQEEIKGPKALWWVGVFVQPIGPIAYLAWARAGRMKRRRQPRWRRGRLARS